MNKPELKIEAGVLTVKLAQNVDLNADGQSSGSINVELKVDLAEVIQEIAKKDMPLLNVILAQLKV